MATEGIAKVKYVNSAGQVAPQGRGVGMWDYIYGVSTVKHREWNVGDRVVLPDGRAYRYGKSAGACWAGRGVRFLERIDTHGLDWVLATTNQAIGDRQITLTNAALAWTKDELRGGMLLVCHATDDEPQNRMIVGNNAVGIGTAVTVYLDGPLVHAVTPASRILVQPCPYRSLQTLPVGTDIWTSVAGVPAAYVDAANKYFWLQTWGPCWVAFESTPGQTLNERQLVWRADGSVCSHDDSRATAEFQQHAGFIIDQTDGGVSATWMMMQVCP